MLNISGDSVLLYAVCKTPKGTDVNDFFKSPETYVRALSSVCACGGSILDRREVEVEIHQNIAVSGLRS